jgi:hypothetical protein
LNFGSGSGISWVASENACIEITGRLSLSGSYTTLLKFLQRDALRPCGCAFCSRAPPNHVTSELLERASKQTIWRNLWGWDVRIHLIRAWPALWSIASAYPNIMLPYRKAPNLVPDEVCMVVRHAHVVYRRRRPGPL